MKSVDLVVIGAGPAGISAAVTGARRGLNVTLLDENPLIGGQVLTQADQNTPRAAAPDAFRRGKELRADLEHHPVDLKQESIVWGIDGTRVAFSSPEGSTRIEASALIIASGAREFVPAFSGWTLPGVMTLGGAQHLIKRYGVLPGKSILLAGTGPLLWALAATALEKGGNLLAILDFGQPAKWIPALPQVNALKDRLGLAWHYLSVIRKHRIRYIFARERLIAHGNAVLRTVSVGNRRFQPEALCVGFGFRPNVELLQLAGCEMGFERSLGGWIPLTDESLQTTRPGVFAAGECAGIGGAEKALLEGELAALAVFSSLSGSLNSADHGRLAWLRKRIRKETRFGRVLNEVCEPPANFISGQDDDLILCRCESIRAGEVKQAIRDGISSLDGLKNQVRVGQGMCQGRTCGPLLQRLLSEELDLPQERLAPFHVRPPVKPVTLRQIERQL